MRTVRFQRTMGMDRDAEGRPVQYFEIDVDTADELTNLSVIDGVAVGHGSIAHVVTTGDFYAYKDNGNWYNQDGSDAPTVEEG